ncbi:hypothetical protein T492DRAFT_887213 [Pavlovales sp. CCMP2436]|nr:hypothetical protein T492DRAFT_887213 [Pavlovales sp. CCMP2436]
MGHGALDALTDSIAASPHALGLELTAMCAGALGAELSVLNVGLWHALCRGAGGEAFALELVLPAVRALLFPSGGNNPQPPRDRQLVAAEVFVGVGLALNGWTDAAAAAAAEAALGALLVETLGASAECAAEWGGAVELVSEDVHPARARWLVSLCLEQCTRLSTPTAADAPADGAATGADAGGTSTSSLALGTWLRLLTRAIDGGGWRCAAALVAVTAAPQLRSWLVHPAKAVRTRAALLLARALQLAVQLPPSALGAAVELRTHADAAVEFVLAAADAAVASTSALAAADSGGGVADEAAADQFHDAVVQLVLGSGLACASLGPLAPHAPALLRAVVRAATAARAPELRNTAKIATLALSHQPLAAAPDAALLAAVAAVARTDGEWRARGAMAALLGPFLFRMQFALRPNELAGATATLLVMLVDPQQEVREACLPLISGLARITTDGARAQLQAQLSALASTPLAASRGAAEHGARVAQRHGGVLGLAALVRSSPYAVPAWLPPVLELLVGHANDPFPVNKEVKATVAEFKRTHQDNWEECCAAFSEEQLSRILDNSSALAHYA